MDSSPLLGPPVRNGHLHLLFVPIDDARALREKRLERWICRIKPISLLILGVRLPTLDLFNWM
jgi:hypothetical protein